ncbi:trypsin-like peptidase domain-containing protein [Rhodoferax antarcticus]|uniref:trypsin-like peptidase domain-containing protein n=1 Tax=Rhodoferax antarcticus TaxID=81479 RepID=UPI002225020D|nr:trypsin-like peptidase domain-containing protein [Rhodoferax antarcticus]MCW2314352.1 serine protease Do/serine protease DegQ [Rhodoferax antarcticus]
MSLFRSYFVCLVSLAFTWSAYADSVRLSDSSAGAVLPSLSAVVNSVSDGVVGISVGQSPEGTTPLLQDPVFKRFFEEAFKGKREKGVAGSGSAEVRPAGSGVVVDSQKGLVLTNHHVIQGATRLVVVLKDRRELAAELVGSDPGTDVAVLRIKPERLVAVPMGDSDAMNVGDFVLAIGNPFSLGQTVTSGIVSALGRGISPEGYEDYIQTDAAINPGNSGGALINLRGELIGINTAILSGGSAGAGRGNIGIGFAVPTSMAKEVIGQILAHGEMKRGRVGIQTEEVTEQVATSRGLPSIAGAVIRSVSQGSTAERAGLKPNDIVLQVDGRLVRTASDLRNRVALVPVGGQVRLQVWRNRQTVSLQVPVEPISATQVAAAQQPDATAPGARTEPGGRSDQSQPSPLVGAQLSNGRDGVVVIGVDTTSATYQVGFRSGDVILAVNRQAVTTLQELSVAMAQSGQKTIIILRGESKLRLTLG